MSYKTQPGLRFTRQTSFPVTGDFRRIYVPAGDVVVKNDNDVSITIVEAEIGAINNQATYLNEITSATGGVVYTVS